MKVSVTKQFRFEAAHHLPEYNGPCANLHGHSYLLEVTATGKIDSVTGMVIDFGDLKDVVSPIVEMFDHKDLNQMFYNPTAEIMCMWIFNTLRHSYTAISRVRLWETTTSYAEVTDDHFEG